MPRPIVPIGYHKTATTHAGAGSVTSRGRERGNHPGPEVIARTAKRRMSTLNTRGGVPGILAVPLVALAVMVAAGCVPQSVQRQAARATQQWVGTWFASPTVRTDQPEGSRQGGAASVNPAAAGLPPAVRASAPGQVLAVGAQSPLHFRNQTLRQIAHLTLGGKNLRVVFSNVFGTQPLTIGAAHVALRATGASIAAGSDRPLTFGDKAGAVIPAGETLASDPVTLTAPDFADLAIDLYLPDDTAAMQSPLTIHPASWQTNYVSTPGNHAGAVTLPVETTTAYRRSDGLVTATWFFLARVEVMAPAATGVVVTLGDSLTDGTASTIDTNNRWPNHLARRLVEGGQRMAVLNAGIGGNRILVEGTGPSALARFERDVLSQPGVSHVVLFEGINDIGQARGNPVPSADELIAAHRQLIDRAHARGLRIFGATLTPFEGAGYWTAEGEAKRQALNTWIRTSRAYDAFFDFDAVVRDPARPTTVLGKYDAGDRLHLNAAGYEAIANAIDLAVLRH
jgi:lysophospholipase L1-like esterase